MESPDRPIFDSREDDHSPFKPEKGADALSEELKETMAGEHHNSNLFDQDEDRAGEKVDLASGKPIDNSTDHGLGHLSIHESFPHEEMDEEDAAAKWLRQNDPNFGKN